VFPRVYERGGQELWREDAILIVEGKVDTRSDRPQLVVDRADAWTAPPKGAVPPPRGQGPGVRGQGSEVSPAVPIDEPRPVANGTHAAAHPVVGGGPGLSVERRVLRVVIPRGEDDNACVRVLEQLHGLIERFPGSDEIRLVLHDRSGGRIELAGADILVRHTADLESQVRTLVGADNLVVVSSAAD
jgi:hypothetical protein